LLRRNIIVAIIHITPQASVQSTARQSSVTSILEDAGVSDPAAKKAAAAYVWAQKSKGSRVNSSTMAVVDFTKPSNDKRLYIVDLSTGDLIGKYYVAHGKGSGNLYARHFSNVNRSHASSLGAYAVGSVYYGGHGRSKRIYGLEKGINDHAASRAIVIHRAPYVSKSFISKHHRAGRSWGCFAVSPQKADKIINQLPAKTLLFAYAKQEDSDRTFVAKTAAAPSLWLRLWQSV
jgi:hypothetical protein